MKFCIPLFLLSIIGLVDSFQVQRSGVHPSRFQTQVFSTLPIQRTAQREVYQFQDWAAQCGVQTGNGFCLVEDQVDGNEDWYAATSSGAAAGSPVLYVPGEMVLSSARIAEEYDGYVGPSLRVLEKYDMQNLFPQFYLFLRIMVEYEKGTDSPYYPWMAALPRKWNTAASMDDFCLSCLPPFIKGLCKVEQAQLAVFREALLAFEYLNFESKRNEELSEFVYNVVFTRAFPADDGTGDYRIVPMADMLNHGYPGNVALEYDANGGCQVVLTENVGPGSPLYMSYGEETNPSRFLATFGFLNEAPATYCKLLLPNPSQELKEIGYDPTRMLFTTDGAISQEVWDVILYYRLERKPEFDNDRRAFYQAHMSGDVNTKNAIHQKYYGTTSKAMQRHVDGILAEIFDLKVKMNSYDSSKHPRLPLIKKHNDMVASTFQKVRSYLDEIS